MRIGIANDTPLAVEVIRRVLSHDTSHKLAWIARDGVEAVQRCSRDRPDLVLMDLLMPQMNGVEATRQIMDRCPCAVMVVTASVNRQARLVFEALNAGALDAARTPSLDPLGRPANADSLLGKIHTISRLIGRDLPVHRSAASGLPFPLGSTVCGERRPLILIGASAGGPAALADILHSLPQEFPAPIIVVQHVSGSFASTLADWLNHETALDVRVAREGDRLLPGRVLLADGKDHLVLLSADRVGYRRLPVRSSYRPSIDVLFSSAARLWPGKITGVVLTGMGRDGAEGLLELKNSGHHTVAQNESTCVVYGIPRAAIELGAAERVLPLNRIGPHLAHFAAPRQAPVSHD